MKIYINLLICFLFIGKIYADDLSKVEEYIYLEKYDDALVLLKTLSDNGNIDAHKTLASIYVVGGYVKQDIKLAILYLNKAVDSGDSDAAFTLLKVINDFGGNIDLEDIERISKVSSKLFKKNTEKILAKIKDKNIINYTNNDLITEKKETTTVELQQETKPKNQKTLDKANRPGWNFAETNWGVVDNIKAVEDRLTGGWGTGFFINSNGYIITNHHVVENCEQALIYPNLTNESAIANKIKDNKINDLAILKINKPSPMYLSISKNKPLLGTDIIVGGFPTPENLGISIKITKGIISGSDTRFEFLDIIDAAIQQGSSGSPVINSSGNIIGVAVGTQIDQKDNNEQTLNYIVNWNSLKKFLKNSYINYSVDNYDKSISTVDLAKQLERTAVTIMCLGK